MKKLFSVWFSVILLILLSPSFPAKAETNLIQNPGSLSCEVVFWNKMQPSAKKAVYEITSHS